MTPRSGGILAVTLAAAVVQAQSAPSPSPSSAPAACSSAEFRQFDFWIGEWDVVNEKGEPAGRNRIESALGGCVLQEHWEGVGGSRGTSLNVYDAAFSRWHQTWVDGRGGLLELDGGLVGGAMVLSGSRPSEKEKGKTVRHRITWTPLAPDRVRQLWESSSNGGTKWEVLFDGTYKKRRG